MKLSEAYPSKYLAADDLQGRSVTVTIQNVTLETIGQGAEQDRKLVISFIGKSKKFVCNKTNAKVIAGLCGQDTDQWAGQAITLAPREVEFQGDMVWAIRVSLTKPNSVPIGTPVQSLPPKDAPKSDSTTEEVPF